MLCGLSSLLALPPGHTSAYAKGVREGETCSLRARTMSNSSHQSSWLLAS